MNRIFSSLQNIILRQIIVVFLVGFTFFGFQAFNSSDTILLAEAQVQRTVTTPEGTYYKGTPDNQGIRNDNQVDNAQKNLKQRADNVREKLNLDQPTPEGTKEFLDSAQTKVEKAVEPLTGTRHGYYQENIREAQTKVKR
jgi:hypothetical protein